MPIQTPTIPSIPSLSGNSLTVLKSTANINATVSMAAKRLLEVFDPQNKNLFEVMFIPKSFTGFLGGISSVASAALDSTITKAYIQSIEVPFFSIEYEDYNQKKSPSHFKYPETVTMTFIEVETGVVREYLNGCMRDMVKQTTDLRKNRHYVFKSNVNENKKDCIIIPNTAMGLPSVGWIHIQGMAFSGMENITFDQKEGEPMYITATFSVENIWWKVIGNIMA